MTVAGSGSGCATQGEIRLRGSERSIPRARSCPPAYRPESTGEHWPDVHSRHGEDGRRLPLVELGQDLSRSQTSAHFDSRQGLCPKNQIGGGNVLSSKTGPDVNRAGPSPAPGNRDSAKEKIGHGP